MSDNHQQYLLAHYQKLAGAILAGNLTPEQFAREMTSFQIELEKRAYADGLIRQFYNSTGFSQALEKWVQLLKRLKINGTLLALDIDHLKRFNDTLGHISGDKLIKIYADVIDQFTRSSDLKGRLGGDEFAVFLVGSDLENAQVVAESIRLKIIEAVKNAFPDLPWEQTISIGVTSLKEEDSAESLRKRADQALYQAKEKRNQTIISDHYLSE